MPCSFHLLCQGLCGRSHTPVLRGLDNFDHKLRPQSGADYTYLLAISPANIKRVGAHHSLKVKVKEPGLTVQARRGYSTLEKHKK
jgi:hypothetical protein